MFRSKYLLSVCLGIPLLFTSLGAVNVQLPKGNFEDVHTKTQADSGRQKVLATVAFVNNYLWFFIGFLCFLFATWSGIQLIISRGNKDEFNKATKMLIGAIVGIFIAFISYGLVRVVVNLL
ncbi:MAG: hypothetical protein PHU61_00285 [Candidatus Absconditabacteria bacterium]|nr:hypothetical protein [Candidatus Absconditabacteria bacterium]MDD3868634.1 hypothetical protein [Candidatus Absconditabacteria bacterium]MDD4714154.1 hypothetical protein [Candidatus Absconditabacteria bacterium]